MSRSRNRYPVYGGPNSLKWFKREANSKLRKKAKEQIRRFAKADKLEELILPVIDEVSDTYDIDYSVARDPDTIAKSLRK